MNKDDDEDTITIPYIKLAQDDFDWMQERFGGFGEGVRCLINYYRLHEEMPQQQALRGPYSMLLMHADEDDKIRIEDADRLLMENGYTRDELQGVYRELSRDNRLRRYTEDGVGYWDLTKVDESKAMEDMLQLFGRTVINKGQEGQGEEG